MRKLFLLNFLCLFVVFSFGQSSFNLKEIEILTHDSSSEFYYPTLLLEFNNHPKSFDSTKAKFLYYGKLYRENYKMFQFAPEQGEFNDLFKNERYKKAIQVGEIILQNDPTNLEILLKLNTCYKKREFNEKVDTTTIKLAALINTILANGNGQEKISAYKVVDIADEYVIMAWLGIVGLTRESTMQQNSAIDLWKVRNIKSGKKYEMHFEWLVNTEQGVKNMKWPD